MRKQILAECALMAGTVTVHAARLVRALALTSRSALHAPWRFRPATSRFIGRAWRLIVIHLIQTVMVSRIHQTRTEQAKA